MPKGFVYILECSDGSYYTGSTKNLDLRLAQHKSGQGSNHTKKRLPVKLVYYKEFQRINEAFLREKQIQGWSRLKKEALIKNNFNNLPKLSLAYRDKVSSRTSDTKKKSTTFYSNGKLLLTGEYVVLDGAIALALPTTFGQSLDINAIEDPKILWKSIDELGHCWFEDSFSFAEITSGFSNTDNAISNRLLNILKTAKHLNPQLLNNDLGFKVTSKLDFPQNWGLGSSSTLINNIANWAKIDAYKLLDLTFGGSGYDIACAQYNTAITYQLESNNRLIKGTEFSPKFSEHLYFLHLNKKQNSREGIAQYKKNTSNLNQEIMEINALTQGILDCTSLDTFDDLITQHEHIISKIIGIQPIKKRLFSDFNGSIKSLGAWGGDFVLITSKENPTQYFKDKGYTTMLSYSEMIL